jgi:hypothetical protein
LLKPVPARLEKRITEIGGLSPNGKPLFRVVRGIDRLTWIGGPWKDYDSNGNLVREVTEMRNVPKYPDAIDKYVFEAWMPPENYGSETEWELLFTKWVNGQRIETLGPFPREGEYELVKVLETPRTKKPVPLTDTICEALVTTAKANRELSFNVKLEAIRRRREREEQAKEQRLIDRLDDMAFPEWSRDGKPHIVVPSVSEVFKYS